MRNQYKPAMPQSNDEIVKGFMEVEECAPNGLSKLEYAAIQAMKGILSTQGNDLRYKEIAEKSVKQAKALFAELEKDNG